MPQADALAAIRRLMAAFQRDVQPDTIALYAEKLADVQPATLAAAVDNLIETSKFFPTIAEIRHAVAKLAGLLPPSSAEALALVRRADRRETVCRRDGSVAYTERFWDWPEDADPQLVELARATLERVGEPCDAAGRDHFAWDTGFTKAYEAEVEAITRTALADLSRAVLPAHEQHRIGRNDPMTNGRNSLPSRGLASRVQLDPTGTGGLDAF